MESVEYLNKFEEALSYDPQLSELYEDKLGWIRARKKDWEDDKIRVGVIGDTSCGKSTMINAILGMNILSSAVVPSSGVLVCCAYGEKEAIIIHFKDGSEKIFVGSDVNQENLIQYSDERHNPKNKYGVSSIELQTPSFELGKNVLLIDSPGLNAYGLESHEKITLETMVPTIDYCIYVTTTKTTSDAHACDVLDTVARYKCPIMLVQNKLDAVREAPGGKKTKQQVAKEHYERLKKVVEFSSVQNKKSVDIIQISAINALKWRISKNDNHLSEISYKEYEESRFEIFIKTVRKRIDEIKPLIEQTRALHLYDSVNEVTTEVSEKIESINVPELTFKKMNYDQRINEIDSFISAIAQKREKMVEEISSTFSDIKKQVNEDINEDNAKTYVTRTNQKVNSLGNKILEFIKDSNGEIQKYCGYVHIPTRDLYKIPELGDYQKVALSFRDEEEQVRQKQAGIKGFFNRFTGLFSNDKDKGYEYVTEIRQHVDYSAVKRDIVSLLNREGERYKRILKGWNDECFSVSIIVKNVLVTEKEKAIVRREAEIEQKKLQMLNNNLIQIENCLKVVLGKAKIWTAKEQVFKEDTKAIEVGDLSSDVLQLSSELKKKQSSEVMKELVRKEKLENHVPILMGWDENCENHFDWNAGISDLRIIHLIEEEPPKEKDGVDTCFFVLVNASQIGMEKKKVKNIRLSEIVETNDFVVWVVQDFEELYNSGGIEEGLRNMLWLREFSEITCRSIVWINHDNPIYNISFLEQQYDPKEEITERLSYLDYLRNRFKTYCDEDAIGAIAKGIMNVKVRA